jgi:hypothetical protein
VLLCEVCNVKVAVEKHFTIQQHISKNKHVNGVQLREQIEEQEKNIYIYNNLLGNNMRHALVIYCNNKEKFLIY